MDNGEWTMDNGEWTMDNGEWTMDNGEWTMENGQWRMELFGVGEGLFEAGFFLSGNGHDSAVTRREGTFGLGVLNSLEGLEVGALAELVVSAGIAVVHQNPCAIVQAEHARTLNGLVRVLAPSGLQFPGASVVEILGDELLDTFLAAALSLEENVEQSFVVLNDVSIDAGIVHVKKQLGLAHQIGEVAVGIAPIHLVVRDGAVVSQQREIDDVAFGLLVVECLRGPHAGDVGEMGTGETLGEVYGAGFPVHHVL